MEGSSTATIRAGYWHHMMNPEGSFLFLFAGHHTIDLLMFDGSKPLVFNSFQCKSREDILYFTLFLIENAGLRPDNVNLCLGGMIDENSDSFKLLSEYFRNLSFFPRLSTFNYSGMFDQVPSQRHQQLFALALCGL